MTSTAFTGIGELVTNDTASGDGSELGILHDAGLVVEDDHVVWLGRSRDTPPADRHVDVAGRCVVPGFVDSHTHLVFAGDRADEFAARMTGQPYRAGGIRTTVAATRAADDDTLRANARRLADELVRQGTTTFEVKSGYGLDVATEVRLLRLAEELTDETTYLGAHVVPAEFADDPAGYVELVTGEMLDACAPHAIWIDVFVEDGAFDVDAARTILRAGERYELAARIHANQLGPGPGVQLACEVGAASADHCTHLTDADVDALSWSGTAATLLPGADFSTRSPFPDGRRLWDAEVTVALATDCNPGTSFTTSMPFVIAVAVRECGLSPSEAVWAATRGGAVALRREDVGNLGIGARADLLVLDAPTHVHLAYRPGVPLVAEVHRAGRPTTDTTGDDGSER